MRRSVTGFAFHRGLAVARGRLAIVAVVALLMLGCAHGPPCGRPAAYPGYGCGRPPVQPVCQPPPVVAPPRLPAAPAIVAPPATVAPPMLPRAISGPIVAPSRPGLILSPGRIIAPAGSDVVLTAGVCGADGRLTTNEAIEWSLGRNGTGQFVAPGQRSHWDKLTAVDGAPERVDPTYARSTSVTRDIRLTRGTATPLDDVAVRSGQAWIAVSSATDGTSYVTAYAPSVKPWDLRRQTAVIHWVDAQWQLPPNAVNPAGTPHTLTTTVTRHTNGAPLAGWIVRYELVGGPPGGFGPQRLPAVEVPTDSFGQASVELVQTAPNAGTNQINVQVIRPIDPSTGQPERLIVGAGTTSKTWGATAAQGQPTVTLRCTGPAQATIGTPGVFGIEITNQGQSAIDGAVVTVQPPPQFIFLSSNPQAEVAGQALAWRLTRLDPQRTQRIEVNLRPVQAGATNFCASVQAPGGVTAQHCTATTVLPAQSLELSVTLERGGDRVVVGETAVMLVQVTNRGDVPARGVVLQDVLDEGLASESGTNPVVQTLGDIGPQEARTVRLALRVLRAGTLCHTATVSSQTGPTASQKHCVTATDPSAAAGAPELTVRIVGPRQASVGRVTEVTVQVTNAGRVGLSGVVAKLDMHAALRPEGSQHFAWQGNEILWQIGALGPGESRQTLVTFRGDQPTTGAWVSVDVNTAERLMRSDRLTLDVVADVGKAPDAAPLLTLSISSTVNPLQVGGETLYLIHLKNGGDRELTDVALEVTLPDNVTLSDRSRTPTRYRVEGRKLIFEPILRLRSIESADYRLIVRADRPGDARLIATATSRESSQPVTAENTTRVIGQ